MSNNVFDKLFESGVHAFSIGNLLKRFGLFILFSLLLGVTKLISGLDQAGARGDGFIGFIKALVESTRYGLGVGHTTLWDVLRNIFLGGNTFIQTHAWGTIIFTSLFFIGLVGFYFQPVSLFINFFDLKGKNETSDKGGNATSRIVRLFVTIIVVLIISVSVFYSGISESYAGGGVNFIESPDDIIDIIINETLNETNSSITNSLNMLTGD